MLRSADADLAGEGYRGFQQKFSPLVVRRALLLDGDQPIHRKVPVGWANIIQIIPNWNLNHFEPHVNYICTDN